MFSFDGECLMDNCWSCDAVTGSEQVWHDQFLL
jgi:hypothetical protein